MVRRSRAQAAAAAIRKLVLPCDIHEQRSTPFTDCRRTTGTPTPPIPDLSEEDAPNTPPQATSQDDEDVNPMEAGDDDDQGTPAVESDVGSGPPTPVYGRASIPRKRRAGRSAKRGSSRRDAQDEQESRDTASDAGTPRKRGGFRGRGFGGGRWGKPRGGPSHVTQVPLDKEGNMANVRDDEVELPEDPEGEEKVDKNGYLKNGREYRVRTFPIEGKGDRLYMLSTEPARCIGFRDSYLFFQKHRTLYKIILAEEAKKDLIERNLIPHSYKGRAIGVVTARSVFREFGARIIIGGKKITDDYRAAAARAQGDVEGEYAVPEDNLPDTGGVYDRNQFVAWHGASSVYHSGAPTVPAANGKIPDGKKRKVIVTGANWMFEHAREARYDLQSSSYHPILNFDSRFNSSLAMNRRRNLHGVYDVHTNAMQYPKIMQPTHARWEQIPTASPESKKLRISDGESANETISPVPGQGQGSDTIFPAVPAAYTRTFMITDTYYKGPSSSTLGYPGPDEAVLDIGPPGLTHVPEKVLAELPDSCRQSFYEARAEERQWKESWGTEDDDHARSQLRITYNT